MARASGELTVDQEDADTREPIPIHRERVSIHVTVRSEADVTAARVASRDLALREGFTEAEASAVATTSIGS